MAPFTPFLSEYIYQKLKYKDDEISIHLKQIPNSIWNSNQKFIKPMKYFENLVNIVRSMRSKNNKINSFKMPVNKITILTTTDVITDLKYIEDLLYSELNVINIEYNTNIEDYYKKYFDVTIKPNKKIIGQTFGHLKSNDKKIIPITIQIQNYLQNMNNDTVITFINNDVNKIIINNTEYTILNTMFDINYTIKNNFHNLDFMLNDKLLVFMDSNITEEALDKYYLRSLKRQIQLMRKDNNLIPSDKINVYYNPINNKLNTFIQKYSDFYEQINTHIDIFNNQKYFYHKNIEIMNDQIIIYFSYLT